MNCSRTELMSRSVAQRLGSDSGWVHSTECSICGHFARQCSLRTVCELDLRSYLSSESRSNLRVHGANCPPRRRQMCHRRVTSATCDHHSREDTRARTHKKRSVITATHTYHNVRKTRPFCRRRPLRSFKWPHAPVECVHCVNKTSAFIDHRGASLS